MVGMKPTVNGIAASSRNVPRMVSTSTVLASCKTLETVHPTLLRELEAARTYSMMTLASLMGIALAFSSPLDNNDSMPRRRLAGYVMTDSNIYTARDAWLANPTAAEATYGHISTWETGGVTDMSYLFCALSAWEFLRM